MIIHLLEPFWNTHIIAILLFSSITLVLLLFIFRSIRLEHRELGEQLEERKHFLDTVVSNVRDAFIVVNDEGTIEYWNPAAEKLFGYSYDEAKGKDLHRLLTVEADRTEAAAGMQRFRSNGRGQIFGVLRECLAIRKDGGILNAELSVTSFTSNGRWFAVGTIRDVSERHRRNQELQNEQQRFASMVANQPAAIYRARIEEAGRVFEFMSSQFETITGRPVALILGNDTTEFTSMVQGEDVPELRRLFAQSTGVLFPEFQIIYRIMHADGQVRWVLDRGKGGITPQGISIVDGALIDLTAQKESEERLRNFNQEMERQVEQRTAELHASESRFQGIFDQTSQFMGILDTLGRLSDVNKTVLDFCGYPKAEIVGRPFWDLPGWPMPIHVVEAIKEGFGSALRGLEYTFEAQAPDRNGGLHDLSMILAGIKNKAGAIEFLTATGTDITGIKEFQRRLLLNERRLETTQGIAKIGTWEMNWRTKEAFWSKEIYQLLEYDPTEVPGSLEAYVARIHPDDKPRFEQSFQTMLVDAQAMRFELRFLFPDGRVKYLLSHVEPVVQDDLLLRLFGYLQDISELSLAERKVRRLDRAIEQSPVSVVITDRRGDIEYVNPMFERITGYSSEEVLGKNPRVLKSGTQAKEVYQGMWNTISSGGTWRGELCNKKKDGSLYWEHASISPVRDEVGEITHYVAVKEDITERRTLIEALKLARVEAERANQAKSDFLANMSHEIRTPLNAVIGFGNLLAQSTLDKPQTGQVLRLLKAAKYLLQLLDDVLDLSKIEADKMSLEALPFDLFELLDQVTETMAYKMGSSEVVRFVSSLPEQLPRLLIGDSLRVRQVLLNLLSNAIKFTPSGQIKLELQVERRTEVGVVLRFIVADTGIGMDEPTLARLFSPFTQGEPSTSRRYGGTGLGLSISSRLIALMGGRMWAESRKNQGSIFFFEAPFTVRLEESDRALLPPTSSRNFSGLLEGCRILLVEDNEVNQEVASQLLRKVGAVVELAENGDRALSVLRDLGSGTVVDLVLMDLHMPVRDGYTTTEAIRNELGLKELPIIGLTADIIAGTRERCLAAGMNEVMSKPFEPERLYAIVKTWCGKGEIVTKEAGKQPVPTAQPELPDFTGIDSAAGLRRASGDVPFYLSLLQRFSRNYENFAVTAEAAFSERRFNDLFHLAHSLKGLAATIGAGRLAAAAAVLEAEARAKVPDPQRLGPSLLDLVTRLHEVLEALRALPREVVEVPQIEEDSTELPSRLVKVRELLQEFDTRALGEFATCVPLLSAHGFSLQAKRIEAVLQEYDFDAAVKLLEDLTALLNGLGQGKLHG
ncbi:MAG: hypothetical protein A2284_05380 [Deltaproteobacteria bacterium RIFOXYA12_FULL_61_11]|nr:MAG: hypothetical protein A2284_05380 [Deltaproteobacteria bacterium RIFOXYA12_FULL_61_11]